MARRLDSPYEGFGLMSAARPKYDAPPPPWPLGADLREPKCRHTWDGTWGSEGERQHQCDACGHWVWEHCIEPTHIGRSAPPNDPR